MVFTVLGRRKKERICLDTRQSKKGLNVLYGQGLKQPAGVAASDPHVDLRYSVYHAK